MTHATFPSPENALAVLESAVTTMKATARTVARTDMDADLLTAVQAAKSAVMAIEHAEDIIRRVEASLSDEERTDVRFAEVMRRNGFAVGLAKVMRGNGFDRLQLALEQLEDSTHGPTR